MACGGVGQVSAAQINEAARRLGIPCQVVAAQITLESGGNPAAVSPTGALGVAQFEPGTWAGLGCAGSPGNVDDAMACYTRLMGSLLGRFNGSVRDALAAYNAGAGNIAAGMGYADSILSSAGQPSASSKPKPKPRLSGLAGFGNQLLKAAGVAYVGESAGTGGFLSLPGSVASIAGILATIPQYFADGFRILAWLATPLHWLRIFVGAAGALFAAGGTAALIGVF